MLIKQIHNYSMRFSRMIHARKCELADVHVSNPIVASNTCVERWPPQSGNSRTLTQGTAVRNIQS